MPIRSEEWTRIVLIGEGFGLNLLPKLRVELLAWNKNGNLVQFETLATFLRKGGTEHPIGSPSPIFENPA
jgi:hypothetical protein